MKKMLFAALLSVVMLPLAAQTTDSPLPLNVGDNTLINPGQNEYVYYIYKASADEEVTVVSTATWEFYVSVQERAANGEPGAYIPFYNGFDKDLAHRPQSSRPRPAKSILWPWRPMPFRNVCLSRCVSTTVRSI